MESLFSLHLMIAMIFNLARRTYQSFSDEELVIAFKERADKRILAELYSRYGHLVMGCCLKYLKQFENAEDTTMRVFADLETKLIRHSIQHFKSWLYQVTKNECLQQLRKSKNTAFGTTDNVEGLESGQDYQENEELLQVEFRLEKLAEGLAQLKGEQRTCVELFYLHQKSYAEISEELDLPLNTVKSAIQNGKRNLKIWIEKHEK